MSAQAVSIHRRSAWNAVIFLVLAMLALFASATAWADPPGRVGRIADTQGAVWIYDDEQGEWIEARRNRPVTAGDRVSTERGARVTIQVGSGTVRLAGDTEIEFANLDDRRVQMRLHNGSVALRLRSNESAREFDVVTNEGRFEPVAAGRYRIDHKDDGSFGAVTAGQMHFEARDSALDIMGGQRAEFWSERGVTHYAWANPADDRFGEWVAREEREDDRDAERAARSRYLSPEMTGAEDLDRNGQWDRHPEYGNIWYPTVVAAGWAPYRYGQWAYVRPWGWTWVDDAPWGFAPFHYGRWVNYGGRWGWCPGQYVARPVYAPALVGWIGGSNVSIGISIGGPSVGWVPLAPREVYYPSYQVTNIYIRNVNVTHRNWQGPSPRYDRAVPTGPISYTNQGVAGGVTVVSSNVLRERQPITNAVIKPVDPRTIADWVRRTPAQATQVVPSAPTPRVVATPGGAVPAAPGANRATPWTPPNSDRFGSARERRGNDGGEGLRGRVAPPQQRGEAPQAAAQPAQPATPAAPTAPADRTIGTIPPRPNSGRDGRDQGERRDRDSAPRSIAPVQPAPGAVPPPGVRPIQPAQPMQPMQPVRPVQPNQPAQSVQPAPQTRAGPGAVPARPEAEAPKTRPNESVREPRGRGASEREADREPPGLERRRNENR